MASQNQQPNKSLDWSRIIETILAATLGALIMRLMLPPERVVMIEGDDDDIEE